MVKKKKAQKKQEETKAQQSEDLQVETVEKQEEENDVTEEDIESLTKEEQLAIEVEEAKDKYLRLYSEFENFRRRNAKERMDLIKTASSDLVSELIPTIDDFERAKKANETQEELKHVKEGFDLIYNKLVKTLQAKGLKVMETEKGTPFDADLHEAVTQFPVEDEKMKGKIIDTVEKGYFLGDKVIRFAKVVIGA